MPKNSSLSVTPCRSTLTPWAGADGTIVTLVPPPNREPTPPTSNGGAMTKHQAPDPVTLWTGVIHLELLDSLDLRGAGCVAVQVHRGNVEVKGESRTLAVIDRDRFTAWLADPHLLYIADDTEWARTSEGLIALTFGEVDYVIAPESLDVLTTALAGRVQISPAHATDVPCVPARGSGAGRRTA